MSKQYQSADLDFEGLAYLLRTQIDSDTARAIGSYKAGNFYQLSTDGHLHILRKGVAGKADKWLDATYVTNIIQGDGIVITNNAATETEFEFDLDYQDTAGSLGGVGATASAGSSTKVIRSDAILPHNDLAGSSTAGRFHALATASVHGFMSLSDKSKLDGIASGAEVNQNAYSTMTGDSGSAAADNKTDTFQIAGDGTYIGVVVTNTGNNAVATVSAQLAGFDARYINTSGDTMTGFLTLNADPTSALHAATKQYVDAARTGLDFKNSCRVASTANVNISSAPTSIDGITLANGDRVLLKNQSVGADNGIYVFNGASSAMTRATDADSDAEVTAGMYTFISEGTANADSSWVLTTDDPITLGSTSLTFVQFSGAGQIIAGNGIDKTGNTISVKISASTTYTASRVVYTTSASAIGTSNDLFFDGSSLSLGVASAGLGRFTIRGTTADSSAHGLEVATSGGASRLLVRNDGQFRFFGSDDGEKVRITETGMVGIGYTADPTSGNLFAVNGNSFFKMPSAGTPGATFRSIGGTNNPGLFVSANETTKVVRLDASASTDASLELATANTARLTISNAGAATFSGTLTVSTLNAGATSDALVVADNSTGLLKKLSMPTADHTIARKFTKAITASGGASPSWAASGDKFTVTVTHNIGHDDYIVLFYRTGSPKPDANVGVERTSTNSVTLTTYADVAGKVVIVY